MGVELFIYFTTSGSNARSEESSNALAKGSSVCELFFSILNIFHPLIDQQSNISYSRDGNVLDNLIVFFFLLFEAFIPVTLLKCFLQ